jgi:hypothetical protein
MIHLRQGSGGQARLRQGFRLRQGYGGQVGGQVVLAALALSMAVPLGVGAQARQPSSTAGSPAITPSPSAPQGLSVTARVDRPAIWVADRLTYTVEIVCPRGVDILVGDLAREKLPLTGLDVVSADTTRRTEGDVTRYAFDYVLTTYRVDVVTPAIGPFPVRYYLARAGQRPEEAAPAGSVIVPPVAVAFRSLLPEDQAIYDVRDGRDIPQRWLPYRLLQPVGLGLVLFSAVPAAFVLVRLALGVRERRRATTGRSSRRQKQSARAAFDEVRATDGTDLQARRAGFARLAALIRQHLSDVCGVAAAGMTPEEIAVALEPCGSRIPIELVASVLESCELARYASPDLYPSPDAWREALGQAEQLLARSR